MENVNPVIAKFRESVHFFHEMETSTFNKERYSYNLTAFVGAARSITFAIQKDGAHRNNFKEWYTERQKEMSENDIARFFVQVRNFSIKEGGNPLNTEEGLRMRHRLEFDGKGNCIAKIRSRSGDFISEIKIKNEPDKPGINLGGIHIPFDSGLFEKIYYFDTINGKNPPERDVISKNVTSLSFEYLLLLDDLTKKYKNEFLL